MKTSTLNNWLSILSNLAVLAGLLFLAYEIQQNTESLEQEQTFAKATVYQERANTRMDHHRSMVESEHAARINLFLEQRGWPDNLEAIEELEELDRYRFTQLMYAGMVRLDNSYYQYRLGLMEEFAWELTQNRIRTVSPTWRYLGIDQGISAPFQKIVGEITADPNK